MLIKKYTKFFENVSLKSNSKILRKNIKVGSRILTKGTYDGVDLSFKTGTVLSIKDYGCILVEFDKSFDGKLHNAEGRGKDKHCFFILLENILSLKEEDFDSIISDYKKRVDFEWRIGDIFMADGIVEITSPRDGKKINLKVDGQIGVVYYPSPEKNTFWVGFSNNFNEKVLNCDSFGYPINKSGMKLNKLNMRELTKEEESENKKDIKFLVDSIKEYLANYKKNDIVVCDGKENPYGITFNKNVGIVVSEYQKGYYIIRFLERFDQGLYDVNYMCGNNNGSIVQKKLMRFAEVDEIEKNKKDIEEAFKELNEINRIFEVGDYVICRDNMNAIDFSNKPGKIIQVLNADKQPIYIQYVVEFFQHFSNNLRKMGGSKTDNCAAFQKRQLKLIDPIIIEKLEKGELMPLQMSSKLDMVFCRSPFKTELFLKFSYFDITDKNDIVSYMTIDKMKRLEDGEDPYKSRFRQQTKIGKFFQMLDKNLSQSQVEKYVNEFKGNYDLCIAGVGDRLKLVSGEAVRFWYNRKSYVTGGGSLNSSCMSGPEKGPEMQMFVDNPDIVQLLILTNDENKLLGRALVWKLEKPEGRYFMDYVYVRYENDSRIFKEFAKERKYITPNEYDQTEKMVCKMNSGKKYVMGKDALDHFDTFRRIINGDTLIVR